MSCVYLVGADVLTCFDFAWSICGYLSFGNKHCKNVEIFPTLQNRQETYSLAWFEGGKTAKMSYQENAFLELLTKTNEVSDHISKPFTFQSLSSRNGRIYGVSSSNPARSDGRTVGGGDNAGHGHFPICGSLKGDDTITLTSGL